MTSWLKSRVVKWDLYFHISFWISLMVAAPFYFKDGVAGTFFFPALFVLGSYYLASRLATKSMPLTETHLSYVFLFQMFSLLGVSIFNQLAGAFYLALVPFGAQLYLLSKSAEDHKDRQYKALVLVGIVCSALVSCYVLTQFAVPLSSYELLPAMAFLIWIVSPVYLIKGPKQGAIVFDRRRDDHKNRLFFHDIINSTHGLTLYLGEKVGTGEGLSLKECESVRNEIKVLQSLIRDHFSLSHKNLAASLDYVSVDFAKMGLTRIIECFLPETTSLTFKIEGDGYAKETMIHFPTFHRIMTNVVKNVAESESKEVIFEMFITESEVKFCIKNRFKKLNDSKYSLEKDLASAIRSLDHRESKRESLGLESITLLMEEMGGEASFMMDREFYFTELKFPTKKEEKKVSLAA